MVELTANRDHQFEEAGLGFGVRVVRTLAQLLKVGIRCFAFPALLSFVSLHLGTLEGMPKKKSSLGGACLSLELTKLAVDREVLQEVFLDKSLGPQSWCGVGINRLGRGFDAWDCFHGVGC